MPTKVSLKFNFEVDFKEKEQQSFSSTAVQALPPAPMYRIVAPTPPPSSAIAATPITRVEKLKPSNKSASKLDPFALGSIFTFIICSTTSVWFLAKPLHLPSENKANQSAKVVHNNKIVFPLAGYTARTAHLVAVPGICRPLDRCRQLGWSGKNLRGKKLSKGIRMHAGADYGAPIGTNVLAAQTGTLVEVKPDSSIGGILGVETANGELHRYVHLARASVRRWKIGQKVHQGHAIAEIGYEGPAWGTGPHLHFELYPKGSSSFAFDVHERLKAGGFK